MPLPNAHWLAQCNRLRNLVGSEIWSHACIFSTTLLLPSTATHAGWNSKCHCYQQKQNKTKTLACIRQIQVHKLWTKVYSQIGLTAMNLCVPAQNMRHYIISNKQDHSSGHNTVNNKHTALDTGICFSQSWQLAMLPLLFRGSTGSK